MILLSVPSTGGGSSDPIETPGVLHVSTSGSDTTGDGSLSNPFLTPAAAFALATTLTVSVIVDFGVGSFTYTSSAGWPTYVSGIRGQGLLTNVEVNLVCSECLIQANSMNIDVTATGAAGADGADGSPAGNGDSGSDSPNITIIGTAAVGDVYSVAGNGGNGGGAFYSETGGTGGTGGNASGTITIRCPVIIGTIIFVVGSGGAGGAAGPDGGSNGAAGPAGSIGSATIITDGAYMVGSSLSSTYWKAGRCSYSAGTPTSDFGGNAIIA